MKLSRAALRPLLAAHERGTLPLVGAACGVTARKSSHNASNARGVAAGKMGRNSSRPRDNDSNKCMSRIVNYINAPNRRRRNMQSTCVLDIELINI